MYRLTPEAGPVDPELLQFTHEAADLSLQALVFHTRIGMTILERNLSPVTLEGMLSDRHEALAHLQYLSTWASNRHSLGFILNNSVETGQPAELFPVEIMTLGAALVQYGKHAPKTAEEAIKQSDFNLSSEGAQDSTRRRLFWQEHDVHDLHSWLEPIALQKRPCIWQRWPAETFVPLAPLKSRAA